MAEIKVFEQCERWVVRKPSDEQSEIPALTFPPAPALYAPAPAPAPAPPTPSAPVRKLQRGGAVAVQNCKIFICRGGGCTFSPYNIYFFQGGAVDPWTYGKRKKRMTQLWYYITSVVTLRCTVRLTVIRYGTVITVHHRILYGFRKFGTVLRSITVRSTVRSIISLDYGKLP